MKIWILLFLIMAAIYDYRDFKIPNKLNGAGALITLVLAGVSGMKAADMMSFVCADQLWIIILYWMPWRWRCEAADGMCNIYRTGNAPVSDFVIYM